MLVVEGDRAKILEMDPLTRAFQTRTTLADAVLANLLAELEAGLAAKAFWRLVVIAPSRRLDELMAAMSSDLRACVSMQCARSELEMPPDEVEARFRRLRSALPFVA